MTFMRYAITSPLFDAKELERERVVVTGEMDRIEAKAQFHLWRAMLEHVFWKFPTRRSAIGTRATVLATTPEQIRATQNRYYVPNNSVPGRHRRREASAQARARRSRRCGIVAACGFARTGFWFVSRCSRSPGDGCRPAARRTRSPRHREAFRRSPRHQASELSMRRTRRRRRPSSPSRPCSASSRRRATRSWR